MAGNPLPRRVGPGRPVPPRDRRPAAVDGAARPDVHEQLDRNGQGVGLGPARVPDGETFTDAPGGHGVDVPKGGSREARRRRTGPGGRARSASACSTLAIAAVVVYFGFTKAIPFRHHFTVSAVFPSANNIRPNAPVRIAGVHVGKVTDDRPRRGRPARPRS